MFITELKQRLDHQIVDRTQDLEVQIELVDAKDKQIVEQSEQSVNEVAPKETKFLSAKDQDVKKETKARKSGAFKNRDSQVVQIQSPQKISLFQTPSPAPNIHLEKKDSTRPLSKEDLGITGLKPSLTPHQSYPQKSFAQARPQSAFEQSQTDDHLEDIEEGDLTLLKTKRFKYYSFYTRVKDQLRSHWNPLIREEVSFMFSTGRSIAALGKKRTSLKITLDQDGYLEEVALVRTSGDRKIDNAAIQAFRLAAPFPRPPKGMLEKDRKIRIFWDFVLET